MATIWLPDQISLSSGVGELAPNCEAKIIDDETGKEAPRGQPGELFIRAPNVMKGYWNKPEATAETLVDGWLRTGDVAYVDDNGIFYIVDRKKVNGWQLLMINFAMRSNRMTGTHQGKG